LSGRATAYVLLLLAAVAWLHSSAASGTTIVPGTPEGLLIPSPWQAQTPALTPPSRGLTVTATQLAVVVNTADPLSVAIADYYVHQRRIPQGNVIPVRFDPRRDELPEAEFTKLRADVESRVGTQVQAYALTWARPYRVGCMSITAAFAFGIDPKYCASGCKPTQSSPYFDAEIARPHDDLHIRPAISIAALDFARAKALIDRGVRSDGAMPRGTAYLVLTDDRARNVRAVEYDRLGASERQRVKIDILQDKDVHDRTDVMFYFIGVATVPALLSNRFLPGAIADHLTSFGGMLTTDTGQMSSLRWLEAGATGSYGTVVEPCNILGKFPNIGVLMKHYLAGETLIEAYWKSVAMPGQGLFIGEPLAAPFRRTAVPGLNPSGALSGRPK
jgi:uncharacterized protein (TIGR03790 family)